MLERPEHDCRPHAHDAEHRQPGRDEHRSRAARAEADLLDSPPQVVHDTEQEAAENLQRQHRRGICVALPQVRLDLGATTFANGRRQSECVRARPPAHGSDSKPKSAMLSCPRHPAPMPLRRGRRNALVACLRGRDSRAGQRVQASAGAVFLCRDSRISQRLPSSPIFSRRPSARYRVP